METQRQKQQIQNKRRRAQDTASEKVEQPEVKRHKAALAKQAPNLLLDFQQETKVLSFLMLKERLEVRRTALQTVAHERIGH